MEDFEGVINTSSEFDDGRINILFHSVAVDNPQDHATDFERAIDHINGARVSYQGPADFTFIRHGVKYTLPIDEAKIGDIFESLPYGIVKKNRTGLGATTLELKAQRNSIVVVPTRALAYEKAKQSKNDNGKYGVLYVGGKITGFNIPTIENYLADEDIKYKKFIVVVDSLPTLLDKIGEAEYKNYFLMIDEIDSYQNDGWYRPNMEKAIDYYSKFPSANRCMVSATIGTFTNPLIGEEAVTEIAFNKPRPREITLQPTDNVAATTIVKIKEIANKHPNDKILVAYNAVLYGILPVIMSLPKKLQAECSVLCGEKSKAHVKEYYSDIISNNLPSKITFMTCTYFVGIDIDERFHLISVATPNLPHTLLSTERLQQIAGRCRNVEGLLSETIIYQVVGEEVSIDYANTNKNGVFLDHFIELQEYVPFEELIRLLPENDTPARYKHFRNAVLLWALDSNHPIKTAWSSTFVVGKCYTGNELTNKFNAIWSGVLGNGKMTERAAIPLIKKYFCKVSQTSVRKNGGQPTRHYKIISLNPVEINGNPINYIPNDADMHRRIRM